MLTQEANWIASQLFKSPWNTETQRSYPKASISEKVRAVLSFIYNDLFDIPFIHVYRYVCECECECASCITRLMCALAPTR